MSRTLLSRTVAAKKSQSAINAWKADPVQHVVQPKKCSKRVVIVVAPPLAKRLDKMLRAKRLSIAELGLVSIEHFIADELTEARVARHEGKRAQKKKKDVTATNKPGNFNTFINIVDSDDDDYE